MSPALRAFRVVSLVAIGAPGLVAGCSPRAQRVPRETAPAPAGRASGPSMDPSGVYRQAGLLVQGAPLPFVGTVRYLAGSSPDSTLVLVTLSLANRALSFTSDGPTLRANYGVTLDVTQGATTVRHVDARQVVRVSSFKETQRADESIVFEQFLTVPPGKYSLGVAVHDEGGANANGTQIPIAVPRFAAGTLSSPVSVYEVTPRTQTDTLPVLIPNPRATVVLGRDTLAPVYLEGYGLGPGARIAVSVLNDRAAPIVRDTVTLAQRGSLSAARLDFPVSSIGVGKLTVAASLVGSADTVRSPLFVSFGEELGITTFDELLSYLRYYASPERLQALRDTPPDRRASAWSEFWKSSDPNPSTPEHEGLRDYFARIQTANQRYREEGGPGWLTDRGKVYITLGEPDQIAEQGGPTSSSRGRAQVWQYTQQHAQFVFVDQSGFGRWRLTPSSEADFQLIAKQERVH